MAKIIPYRPGSRTSTAEARAMSMPAEDDTPASSAGDTAAAGDDATDLSERAIAHEEISPASAGEIQPPARTEGEEVAKVIEVEEVIEEAAMPVGRISAEGGSPVDVPAAAASPTGDPVLARGLAHGLAHGRLVQTVLIGAFALDHLFYGLAIPFLPARAHALGASPFVTGALFASYAGGLLFCTPVAGWLTNHLGPRRTLLIGVAPLLGATMLFATAPTLALLFVARAIQGGCAAFTWTAGLAFIAQRFGPRERPVIFGRVLLVQGVGLLLGPPLGGVLYNWGGFRAPFLFAAGLAALDGLGRILVLPSDARAPARAAAEEARPNRLLHGQFVGALLATAGGALLLAGLEPALPPFLSARYGLGTLDIGLLFGGLLLVFSLLAPVIGLAMRWLGAARLVLGGMLVCAAAFLALGLSTSVSETIGALAAAAIGASLVLTPTLEMLSQAPSSGDGERSETTSYGAGTRYAAYNLAYAGGLLLGPVLSGSATSWLGASAGLGWLGLIPLALIAPFRWAVRRPR